MCVGFAYICEPPQVKKKTFTNIYVDSRGNIGVVVKDGGDRGEENLTLEGGPQRVGGSDDPQFGQHVNLRTRSSRGL